MMKTKLPFSITLILFLSWSTAFGQTLVQEGTNFCLNAKNSKAVQCLDLKKSPIAIEYVRGAFRMFPVPGKSVGAAPKEIFMSKRNTMLPVKSTISLKGNIFAIWNSEKKRVFELPFLPGTRGVFQFEKGGNIAFYSEDCLELEPIEVREGQILYDGSDGASSIYFTLVERDEVFTKLICKEGVGISCIEDNIIDPRFYTIDLNLEDAFGSSFPANFPDGGMPLPEGDARWAAIAADEPICKECEEVTENDWATVCEIDLSKKGLYKDCNGHLLVVDLGSGAVCLDVNLEVTALKVESVEGGIVSLSLPAASLDGGEGCCPEQ